MVQLLKTYLGTVVVTHVGRHDRSEHRILYSTARVCLLLRFNVTSPYGLQTLRRAEPETRQNESGLLGAEMTG